MDKDRLETDIRSWRQGYGQSVCAVKDLLSDIWFELLDKMKDKWERYKILFMPHWLSSPPKLITLIFYSTQDNSFDSLTYYYFSVNDTMATGLIRSGNYRGLSQRMISEKVIQKEICHAALKRTSETLSYSKPDTREMWFTAEIMQLNLDYKVQTAVEIAQYHSYFYDLLVCDSTIWMQCSARVWANGKCRKEDWKIDSRSVVCICPAVTDSKSTSSCPLRQRVIDLQIRLT